MNHEHYRDALSALRDGELKETERRDLAAHLDACGECRETLDRWSKISGALFRPASKITKDQSSRFARVVMARIRQEADEAPAWWRVWALDRWLVPALSAGVVAAALAIAFYPGGGADGPAWDEVLLLSQCRSLAKWCVPPGRANVDSLFAQTPEN
ncbi:MAG: zf-HC2 domain-containing protein [Elusimicrobia bacterium]|nr:zf-HC2 domain-containing protein [Elusimicrobiota bacterium]